MSILPKYADIPGGADGVNGNRHYKVYSYNGGVNTQGVPGVYHIYADGGEPQFVVDTSNQFGGGPNSMADSAAAALAPPPAASNGGVAAPASASVPAPASSSGVDNPSQPQNPDDKHDWKFNSANNQWYYEEKHDASDGSSGFFHVYPDGTRVYVAKTPADAMSGNTPNSMADSAAAALASSPAPAISPNDAMQPNPTTAAPSWNAPSNPTGGTLAPDSMSGSTASAAAVSSGNTYTVVEGDTMWGIAQKNGMSLDDLRSLNPKVQDLGLIHPGEQINLGGTVAAAPETASFPSNSTYDTTTTQPQTASEPQKVGGLGGWSDGTSSVPNDPTHGITNVAQTHDTDPLKISDNKDNA